MEKKKLVVYPENIFDKLGFKRIRDLLSGKCYTEYGSEQAQSILPTTDIEFLQSERSKILELVQLLNKEEVPSSSLSALSGVFKKAHVLESYLTEEDFFSLLETLLHLRDLRNFYRKRREDYPILWSQFDVYVDLDDLITEIQKVINKKGEVRSNASKELQDINSDLIKNESLARARLNGIFRNIRENNWAPDTDITIRDDRLVIPLFAEHKRKIKGIIHGESSTGQTVYLEPTEVMELNNEVRNLHLARRREIIRILVGLTDVLRPEIDDIEQQINLLGRLDLLRARALFAREFEASMPEISDDPKLSFVNSRHPILIQHLKEQKKIVIPLDISIDESNKIIVLSGPNAGGKSVSLKTIGLLQLMLQSAIPVPMNKESKAGIFSKLMIDIGDEQSIDNDLSTYSSHLSNMKYFTENSDEKSLFLIDEFGTGTDPRYGGAIAVAILRELHKSGGKGLVNTHYSDLKTLAAELDGLQNAAMDFDSDGLRPLYKLRVGKPGSSFALEIAKKIGLSEKIIKSASEEIGEKNLDMEGLLLELERKEKAINDQLQLSKMKDRLLEETLNKYKKEQAELTAKKSDILRKANAQANAVLQRANQLVERTIKEIKEKGAEKASTAKVRKEFDDFKAQIEEKTKEVLEPKVKKLARKADYKIGESVHIDDNKEVGVVIEADRKNITVEIGALRVRVKADRLTPVDVNFKSKPKANSAYSEVMTQAAMDFKDHLDLRGERREDALEIIRKQVEWANVLGRKRFTILHGKGNGVLRKGIRQLLGEYKEIKSYKAGHPDTGGEGITNVELH